MKLCDRQRTERPRHGPRIPGALGQLDGLVRQEPARQNRPVRRHAVLGLGLEVPRPSHGQLSDRQCVLWAARDTLGELDGLEQLRADKGHARRGVPAAGAPLDEEVAGEQRVLVRVDQGDRLLEPVDSSRHFTGQSRRFSRATEELDVPRPVVLGRPGLGGPQPTRAIQRRPALRAGGDERRAVSRLERPGERLWLAARLLLVQGDVRGRLGVAGVDLLEHVGVRGVDHAEIDDARLSGQDIGQQRVAEPHHLVGEVKDPGADPLADRVVEGTHAHTGRQAYALE